jgi:hypothetical protein
MCPTPFGTASFRDSTLLLRPKMVGQTRRRDGPAALSRQVERRCFVAMHGNQRIY